MKSLNERERERKQEKVGTECFRPTECIQCRWTCLYKWVPQTDSTGHAWSYIYRKRRERVRDREKVKEKEKERKTIEREKRISGRVPRVSHPVSK